jgi:hypothetical protein
MILYRRYLARKSFLTREFFEPVHNRPPTLCRINIVWDSNGTKTISSELASTLSGMWASIVCI